MGVIKWPTTAHIALHDIWSPLQKQSINDLGSHVAPGVPAVSVLRIHACACPCVSVRVEKLYFTPPVLI